MQHDVASSDRRVAGVIRRCMDIPGQQLFQYLDEDGGSHPVDSGAVNAYLRDAGAADFTAKHYRTWAGSVMAYAALQAISGSLAHAELFGHEKGSFTGAIAQNAGYFEYASGGTLFLDEVTEMPPDLQVNFLRVLEAGTYQRVGGSDLLRANVRIICASNRDPHASVAEGKLRQDFLHRLLVIPLRVPALRERGDDALMLAHWFLDTLNEANGTQKAFSLRMLEAISRHDWPGNVRELRNAVQRAYILADGELETDLPAGRRDERRALLRNGALTLPVGMPLAEAQRAFILATLAHHAGDKRIAAETLGLSLKTLYNRLDDYDKDGRPPSPDTPQSAGR